MFDINKRFLQIVDYLNISAYKLSKELDTSEAVLSNIKKGKNRPSTEIIEKLLNNYKVISPTWLMTGQGEMIINPTYAENKLYNIIEEPGPIEKTKSSSPSTCIHCKEKERTIEALQRIIDTQADYIETLKEVSPVSSGQKRKAS